MAVAEVLNKKNSSLGIYIGRPSKWGNPFKMSNEKERTLVIEQFEEYLYSSGLIKDIGELKGKDLVCWCAPKACHGDVLLRLANESG